LQSIHQNICGIMVVFFLFPVPIYEHSSAHGLLLSLPWENLHVKFGWSLLRKWLKIPSLLTFRLKICRQMG
jgi:hypothetical protein